jgi:hypothetical protein
MKKIIIFIFLIFIFVDICYSAEGGYAGSFLRIGLGARPMALGGAFVAIDDDPYSAYYNPAGLPFLKNKYITTSIMILSLDRTLNYLSFSRNLKPSGGFSIGWINAGVGNIDERDFEGEKIGTINYSENAFYFSFAQAFKKNVAVGLTGKILYHKLYQITAKGFGWDFGVLIKPKRNLNFGILIKDLNASYTWNSNKVYERGTVTEDKFPYETKGGFSYYIEKYNILFSSDVSKNGKSDAHIHIGIEKVLYNQFSLRGGINKNNICFGGGVRFSFLGKVSFIDYSFENVEFDESPNQILTLILSL